MFNLFLLEDNFSNGLSSYVLDILSVLSIICSVSVIISKNPVVSVLFLIGLFLSIASYLIVVGISFIGLSYLLVYVGAVSILFLFILMLINVRVSELTTDNTNSVPLSIVTIIIFNITLGIFSYNSLLEMGILNTDNNIATSKNNGFSLFTKHTSNNITLSDQSDVLLIASSTWDGTLSETSHITSIGNVLYTSYPILLLITSIILLLAMVGAIVITIKK